MPNGSLNAESCASGTTCTAVGDYENSFGTQLTLAERWNGSGWTIERTPNPSGAQWSSLFGVSCPSARACMATGYYLDATGRLFAFAERWQGTRWTIQPIASPAGDQSGLFAVSCPSAQACIATGLYATRAGTLASLAEAWNGTNWRVVATPDPAGSRGSELLAVSCTSANACTAAGDQVTSAGADVTLAERWNGTSWAIQSTPNPARSQGAGFSGISCESATACTAAGSYGTFPHGDPAALAEAWNGKQWRIQKTPFLPGPVGAHGGNVFAAVSCSALDACTAVGAYVGKNLQQVPLAERWNGIRWRVQATPQPTGSLGTTLQAVSCPSSATCIAAGNYPIVQPATFISGVTLPTVTLAETWQRGHWRIKQTPNQRGAALDDDLSTVSCTTAKACTAVGYYTDAAGIDVAQAARWNGTSWAIQSTPPVSKSISAGLNDVSCTSPRLCVAVGSYVKAGFAESPLAERWNGARWVIQPTPRIGGSGASDAVLIAVSCASARFCMAVGSMGKGGSALAMEWNGTRWRIKPTPHVARSTGAVLDGVSCTSALTCIAVGGSLAGNGQRTLAERWNGTGWTIQPTPNVTGAAINGLSQVSCPAPLACTAVGVSVRGTAGQRTLAESWNGHRWVIEPTPNRAAGSELSSVSCASARSCTAAGNVFFSGGATLMLVEVRSGGRWTVQAAPALNAYDSGLSGVSCTSPGACTAVGFYFGLTGFSLNLAVNTPGPAPRK